MLIARFVVKTATPLHIGGGSSVEYDQPVSRDPFGFWNIQASSLAGSLRSFLKSEGANGDDIFGSNAENGIRASDVWLSDGVLLDFDGRPAWEKACKGEQVEIPQGPFIRDHVKINLATGAAERSAKYDEEIVPPGAMFAFEMSLDPWNSDSSAVAEEGRRNFLRLFNLVKSDGFQVGGKAVNGYGSFTVEYAELREFDLRSPEGIEAWLNLSNGPRFASGEGAEVEVDADELRGKHAGIDATVSFSMRNTTPVLVGGSNTDDIGYDMVFLKTPVFQSGEAGAGVHYLYTIPGSSTKGVIRHRVASIAEALGYDGAKAANSMFGCIGADGHEEKGSMGHVFCKDVMLDQSLRADGIQHVAIDKFTGGAMDNALFDEAPIARSFNARFSLEVRNLDAFGARLLAHALIDLFTGELPIGGGASRGNGRFLLQGLKNDCSNLKQALAGIKARVFVKGVEADLRDAEARDKLLEMLDSAVPAGGM